MAQKIYSAEDEREQEESVYTERVLEIMRAQGLNIIEPLDVSEPKARQRGTEDE